MGSGEPERDARGWSFGHLDAAPLVVTAAMTLVTFGCARFYGIGYAGGPVTTVFVVAFALWLFGFAARLRHGEMMAGRLAEAAGLLLTLSLLASVTSVALAVGSGPMIDDTLAGMDQWLVPWVEWRAMIDFLAAHPPALSVLSYIYVSLNWQPLLLVGLAGMTRKPDVLRRFVAAWALGIALCILPFHWLAAVGPYHYYGIGPDRVPGHLVPLPFVFLETLTGLRNGTLNEINSETVTGLVSFPSFHACAAVLLGWAFSAWPKLRWPMIALNAAMFLSAIPIGGHYFVDIVAGAAVALMAIAAAELMVRQRTEARQRVARLARV